MKELCERLAVVIALLALFPSSVRAALHLPLRDRVELADLIVRCKAEVEGNTVKYRVVETWKGKYSPDLFYHNPDLGYYRPPEGYVSVATVREKERLPPNGQEAIFFYAFHREPSWTKGKFLQGWPSFEVTGGKIIDPPGATPPPPLRPRKEYATEEEFEAAKSRRWVWLQFNHYEEYTPEKFKKAVLDAVKRQKQDPTKNR